jgi:HSP20 family protein
MTAMTMLTEPHAPWLRDLNRLFTSEGAVSSFIPPADLIVGDDGVAVYMDVPGLNADSLEIELENDTLTVRGERPYPYQRSDGDGQVVRHVERRFGRFERSLRVPRGMNPDAVEAQVANGVLTLHIPKPEELKPHRIEVKAGGSQPRELEGTAS